MPTAVYRPPRSTSVTVLGDAAVGILESALKVNLNFRKEQAEQNGSARVINLTVQSESETEIPPD